MENYAADVIYHSLNAVAFGVVYMIGVMIFMASKSALLGGAVDTFSTFDTMSPFARRKDIKANHRTWLETTREMLFRARKISVDIRTITSGLRV